MSTSNVTWHQGWKIILRCAQFNCRESGPKYASTAILKQMPPGRQAAGALWLRPTARSVVLPEEAFDTADEANSHALSRAWHRIAALNAHA